MADENPEEAATDEAQDPNATLDQHFEPAVTSSPIEVKNSVRFIDESFNVSKVHVMPSMPVYVRSSFEYQKSDDSYKHYSSSLPSIEERAKLFRPIAYTFRMPTKGMTTNITNANILCPPFYLLLDHTIGVLWSTFSPKSTKKLGISQLQWATGFLRSIHNRHEEFPTDVQLAIEILEDGMLEQYSDMGDYLETLTAMSAFENSKNNNVPIEADVPFSVNYFDLAPKITKKDFVLDGGPLADIDDYFKEEVEEFQQVAGTLSPRQLMASQSREDAINFLHAAQEQHKNLIETEIRRLRSVENMLLNITSPNEFPGFTDISKFSAEIATDIDKTHDSVPFNTSNVSSEPDSHLE